MNGKKKNNRKPDDLPFSLSDKLLLSPRHAGFILSLSESKIYEFIRKGTLRAMKIDGSTRILRTEIDHYVQNLSTQQIRITTTDNGAFRYVTKD